MRKAMLLAALAGLIVGPVLAADIPSRGATGAAVQPASNWTGWYAGLIAGYGFNNEDTRLTGTTPLAAAVLGTGFFPSSVGSRVDGGVVGLRAGYDFQFHPRFVAGASFTWSYAGLRGTATAGGNIVAASYTDKIDSIIDLLGRAGWLANERTLLYATVGASGADVSSRVVGSGLICAFGVCPTGASSGWEWGWTVGAGAEYRLDRNIALSVEYLYSDFGTASTTVTLPPIPATVLSFSNARDHKLSRVQLGLAYRF